MKKFTALVLVLVILVVMSLTLTAHAEVRVIGAYNYAEVHMIDGSVGLEHHYVVVVSNSNESGTSEIEVSAEVYNEISAEIKRDEEAYNSRWDVVATRWVSQAAHDTLEFIVFWD